MMAPLQITDVRFKAANKAQIESGLLGFVSAIINDALRVEGLALRRTGAGRLVISFPARIDRYGIEHDYLAPVSHEVRRHIEAQLLRALGHVGEAAR